ncbi:MAG: GWxTD domain-containing protein [bacterium]
MSIILPLAMLSAMVNTDGSLKVNLDQMVYQDSTRNFWLEISYEIPYYTLSFLRDSSGYACRFRLTLEVLDKKNIPISAEVWERRHLVSDYSSTQRRDLNFSELIATPVPATAMQARIKFFDLQSERQSTAIFPITVEKGALLLRLLKSGQINPSRTYGLNDTVEILAEANTGEKGDSVRFLIRKGTRVMFRRTLPMVESVGIQRSRFFLPIAESADVALLGSGVYTVEATLAASKTFSPASKTVFEVNIPFYYDDSLWSVKVDQLLYIASYDEMRKLKKTPRSERRQAWMEFWQAKDPNPSTEVNEKEEEYFERITYCEDHFGRGDKGYRSDRARVYLEYGPPDQIESRPFDIDQPAQEIWYYYERNLTFLFVDRFGSGQFVLVTPGGR